MDQILRSNSTLIISAVAGMGGLGKTELAVQYATRHLADYPGGICWLNGRVSDFASQILQIATLELGLVVPQEIQGRRTTTQEQVMWCWRNWQPAGMVLVVLDDVASWEQCKDIVPKEPQFRVLVTTRSQDLARQFLLISLDVLPLEKAVELLGNLERCGRVERDRSGAEALCEQVGRLPLGIELVGRYLANDRFLNLAEMGKRLRQKGLQDPAFEKPMNAEMTAQLGVKAAFELTWERLAEPLRRVARLLGYFALDQIPWAVVEGMMQTIEGEEYSIREAQRDLDNASVVEVKTETLEMCRLHPLIQKFVREKEAEEIVASGDRSLREAFTSWMLAIARKIPENPPTVVIREVEGMRSHLEELAECWTDKLEGNDLLWAFAGIARFYAGQGLYSQAETCYRNCLTITESRYEGDHPAVALSLNNLAYFYNTQGRLSDAELLYVQALEMTQRLFEGDHPTVARSLNNLALLYDAQGRLSDAEPLLVQALEMRQRLFEGDHPDVASSLNNLAYLYKSQERLSEAEPLLVQALEMTQRLSEGDYPDVASSLNNLAGLYRAQGRLSDAEPLLVQALKMYQRLFEGDHPDVALSLNNLALLYKSQGRLSEAEPLYIRVLEMYQRLFEGDHPDVARNLGNLGAFRYEQGRLQEAEALLVQAFEMFQRVLGDQHPDTLSTLQWLQYVRSQM